MAALLTTSPTCRASRPLLFYRRHAATARAAPPAEAGEGPIEPPLMLGVKQRTALLQKEISGAASTSQLLEAVTQNLAAVDAIHASTALYRTAIFSATPAARLAVAADPRWLLLLGCVEQQAGRLDARGVASSLWSIARLHPECPSPTSALTTLQNAAAHHALWDTAAPQSIANAAWAQARLTGSTQTSSVLAALAPAAAAKARLMKPGELAQVLHAFGSAGYKPSGQWAQRLWAACDADLDAFAPRELAIVLWSYARLAHNPGGSQVRRMAERLAMHKQACDLQAVSLTFWALATLKEAPAEPVLAALFAQAASHLGTAATPQPLCNLLWGAAQLRHDPGPTVVSAALSRAMALAPALRPADVAQLSHALIQLRYAPGPRTVDAIGAALLSRLLEYSEAQLVGILHALGRMGWKPAQMEGARLVTRAAGLGNGEGLVTALSRLGVLPK